MAIAELVLPLHGGMPDTTDPPGFSQLGPLPYLTFDGTTDEKITWTRRMPSNYASGLTVKVQYTVGVTSGVVAIRSQVMAVSEGESLAAESFDTLQASADSTVPGTANLMKEISFALTNVDSLAGGDYFAIQLGRENTTSGTNASGDMKWWAASLTYTTT